MNKIGFVCFGEINTPISRIELKHDHALKLLKTLDIEILDGGIVVDDSKYETANRAISLMSNTDLSCLVVCVAGWVPSHVVIRVTDVFRNLPMVLWGLCGWMDKGKFITTADQAGTTALRYAFESMNYKYKYVYSVINEDEPVDKIHSFIKAALAAKKLRNSVIGTMGYRDMLLYGTQFEGNSLRRYIGVEVEPFEMLEMVQNIKNLDNKKVEEVVSFAKENWVFKQNCNDSILKKGSEYALAIGKKIEERKFDAVTLIDVDGMKKLVGFPPAMVFMLLDHYYDILTIPENDVMGSVTQLIMKYLSGQNTPYFEYYEFFKDSMLIGVPDYVPESVVDGDITVLPTAFGLLSTALVNISKVKTGYITCARLIYKNGKYCMHMFTALAESPMDWEEFGWSEPAPQLPSLVIFPDSCTVEEFAQKVSSQHVIIAYGDFSKELRDLCYILDLEIL